MELAIGSFAAFLIIKHILVGRAANQINENDRLDAGA